MYLSIRNEQKNILAHKYDSLKSAKNTHICNWNLLRLGHPPLDKHLSVQALPEPPIYIPW